MQFTNPTAFPALAYECVDQHDETFRVVAVRVSLEWRLEEGEGARGHRLVWSEDQEPLVMNDAWYGDPLTSSVRFESDLAPYKPRCDLVIHGHAHAPLGRPAGRWPVGVRVEAPREPEAPLAPRARDAPLELVREKRLLVTGPRAWRYRSPSGWELEEPEPALVAPLTYEHAYGGEHRPPQRAEGGGAPDPAEHIACETNTVGRGYLPADAPAGLRRRLEEQGTLGAPRIEDPADPVREIHRAHALQGFGFVSRHWQPRLALGGTFDEAWKKERWPWLPRDFRFEYWNGAHPDLQIPHLAGGERITLLNLTPFDLPGTRPTDEGQTVVLEVPEHHVLLEARGERGERVRIGLPMDTLVLDTDQRLAWATYRVAFPAEAGVASATLIVDDPERILRLLRQKPASPPPRKGRA